MCLTTLLSVVVLPVCVTSLGGIVMTTLPLCNHVTITVDGIVIFSEHVKVIIVAVGETIYTSLSVDG